MTDRISLAKDPPVRVCSEATDLEAVGVAAGFDIANTQG